MKEVFKPAENVINSSVIQAIKKSNEIQNELLKKIVQEPKFLWSDINSSTIATEINMFIESGEQMEVHIYFPRWRWSKAIGYFNPAYPRRIYLNGYKLARTRGSIAATLWHELVHAVDSEMKDASFGHKDNKWTPEKEKTAPYRIDFLAEQLVDNTRLPSVEDDGRRINQRIKVFTWWKPWTWF